jgi:hypothetical protein
MGNIARRKVKTGCGTHHKPPLFGGKAVGAWNWSPISIQCWGWIWTKLYLTTPSSGNNLIDRYQRVVIRNKSSNTYHSVWNKVIRGAPQTSVLGPLFFLIYINYLPGMINPILSSTLFAYDTNIIFVHHNSNSFKEKIEEITLRISKWFQAS